MKPVRESQADWAEVFKVNFNSKTKYMLKVSTSPVQKGFALTHSFSDPSPIDRLPSVKKKCLGIVI